eukprot:CAMPEP_0117698622 /NCGR_PEP_ID=MMETSP0804-20121206/29852_1 /TAXON_ID=1074897 /ORGANISM="Tetraselmis astigmatica, Strain CCMP880" /LENGTH=885 /DNA_ID=CAMNT_0005512935 /DNA_START=195 /DNA_END=2852 /DNA_ORIENTATION=+
MSTPGILPAGALGSRLQAAADFPSRAPFLFPRSWPAALCPPWRPALGGSLWGADRPSCRNTHSGPGASINPRVDAAVFGAQPDALLTTDSIDLSEAQFDFGAEIEYLQDVLDVLIKAPSLETKVELLLANPRAAGFFQGSSAGSESMEHIQQLPLQDAYLLYCLPVMNQWEVLAVPPADGDWPTALRQLAEVLRKCDVFYDAIGGLIGYQIKVCQLILEGKDGEECSPMEESCPPEGELRQCFLEPPSLDISQDQAKALAAAVEGLRVVIPLGGAGDRLGLVCERTGDSLPTAMLQYCGRTLLEAIIRDLQAREYLYFRVFGEQKTTPVAVMTSDAKGNHSRIAQLLSDKGWFGRGVGSFSLFCQPLVPVVSVEDGKWLVSAPLDPLLKPGGHGVIWKLMQDNGVFSWLQSSGRRAALVRQISNPLAGTDKTLLALSGIGRSRQHAFGFASCERAVGAAEGMNVLVEETVAPHGGERVSERRYGITNVEYTEFERLGITDEASGDGASTSMYPANTNILYVGLEQAVEQLQKGFLKGGGAVLPGMIFNLNKRITYTDVLTGVERSVRAGRMECTMQNLADCFRTPLDMPPGNSEADSRMLDTFLVYNLRRRTTSSAKRKLKPGSTHIHQTPDGSFLDLQRNGRDVLSMCGMEVPKLGGVTDYLDNGPGFVFLFHPALGPVWEVVQQKIRGGKLGSRSELVLEVTEVDIDNLVLCDSASLQITAECVMGHHAAPASLATQNGEEVLSSGTAAAEGDGEMLIYSNRCGRVRLYNVTVENSGIDWEAPGNCFWAHHLSRRETCEVLLHGNAELEARDCLLAGDLRLEVPDGHRLTLTSSTDGSLLQCLEPLSGSGPSWEWAYSIQEASSRIELTMGERLSPKGHLELK